MELSMPVPVDLMAEIYELYVRAAVELRQITWLESNELRHLRQIAGVHTADIEQIRQVLIVNN
jgi:hypothetical protein